MKLLSAILLTIVTQISQAALIDIQNASIKLNLPGQKTTAAFMNITNNSDQNIQLLSATGDFAQSLEIHEMKMNNGRMTMRPLETLIIPAHQTVELKHGGYHIMIFDLKKPLELHNEYRIILKFDHNQKIDVKAKAIN